MPVIVSQQRERLKKMEMSWIEWATLAVAAVVGLLLPFVLSKYVDAKIKLAMATAGAVVARSTVATGFLLESKMWRSVVGQAFVILADGRVFAFPGRKVAEAAFLSCVKVYFDLMTDRGRRGLDNDEIERKLPEDGMIWRVKVGDGDAIVYFETIFGKGVRTALGVDAVEVQTFWTELESVRAGVVQAMRAEARRSEDRVMQAEACITEGGEEVEDGE